MEALSKNYLIKYNDWMELITVRHYTDKIVHKLVGDRKIYAEQRTRTTIQVVVKGEWAKK